MSEEKKWTPGPWYVSADTANDCPSHKDLGLALVDTGCANDWPIARLCEWGNARLIAAAPDLYDALVDLLDLYTTGDCDGHPREVVEQARAVLGKAEGR